MATNHSIFIQDIARKQIETTKQVYLLSPERMFSEFNGEKANVKNYNGRQLLEMLQNADDAAIGTNKVRKVFIKLSGARLIIANTGAPFSEDGLKSIFHSHLSPKEAKENQIGKKGLGFRSILSWANEVTIKSHGLCVAFSEAYSKTVLGELRRNSDFEKEFLKRHKDKTIHNPISTLVCPNVQAQIDSFEGMDEYDTIIQIDLHPNAIQEVKKQIQSDLDAEVLLFLKHLSQIDIDVDGELSSFTKTIVSEITVDVNNFINNVPQNSHSWYVNTITGRFDNLDQPYELSLALPLHDAAMAKPKNVVYAYFRTKVPITCEGILHGSFELTSDRSSIVEDDYNKQLVALLPEFVAQTAAKIADYNLPKVDYKAVHFLAKLDFKSFNHLLGGDFKEKLLPHIKNINIFPSINSQYVSWMNKGTPVYYSEKSFSENLNPQKFTWLLQYCEDKISVDYIELLKPCSYKIVDIIKDVTVKRDSLSTEVYAQLVIDIHKHLDANTILGNNKLFYDENKQFLTFDQPIFLPNPSVLYELPSNLGVQIISKPLSDNLSRIMDCEYVNLPKKLNYFKIKEYKFSEIVELLITHYRTSDSFEKVIELNKHLFNIFSNENEKIRGINWEGSDVHLISKKDKCLIANSLYFGKDYGHAFTEEIYHYDLDKIVISPNEMKMEAIDKMEWKKYLEWLGVAAFPRKWHDEGEQEHAEYVMKHFDYTKTLLYGDKIKNFSDFKKNLTKGYEKFEVWVIDDMDNILKHNKSETILQLVAEDDELRQSLETYKEHGSSYIAFNLYNAKDTRYVRGNKMQSYLKWKLERTKWLLTEGGEKHAPIECATAAYITEDFRGLVEKPKLDYDALKKRNITKERADYLLVVLGVHKTLDTVSTNMLYSMLLELPKIDLDGKKAKTIYNQLATDYNDKLVEKLDKTDLKYIEFHQFGQVFCKNGSYKPIQQVFYVNDKSYGETIIKQFDAIEIDRRRGKDKIEKLFGVKPLDKVILKLEGEPTSHDLSTFFKAEMERFKPYIYALRQDMNKENEKKIIKDIKFHLVTDLKLSILADGHHNSMMLKDYEHFYLEGRTTVFIKTPKQRNDIQILKEDIPFCSVIAEAFSSILDVETQRQLFRELFSKTDHGRDELLRSELDDNNLEKLDKARKELGIMNDPKLEFWKSFAKCFDKNILPKKDTDEALLEQLNDQFLEQIESIEAAFSKIDYADLNKEGSLAYLVPLFQAMGLTLENFNKYHYPPIHLRELYEMAFKRARDAQKDAFKSLYYEKCCVDDALKQKFKQDLNDYDFIRPNPNFKNEIDFDVNADLNRQVSNHYSIRLDAAVAIQQNIDDFYHLNLTKLQQNVEAESENSSLLMQFIDEKLEVQSLLYFENKLDRIKEKFKHWLGKDDKNGDKTDVSPTIKSKKLFLGQQNIFYNDLKELSNRLTDAIQKQSLKGISSEIKTKKLEISSDGEPMEKNDKKHKSGQKMKIPKEEIGFVGEHFVYHHLLGTIRKKENVKWVSAYAKACGVNLDGQDGLGYDIVYIPTGAKHPRYVEVKVVGWKNEFHISSNEVKYAEKYKQHYEIFLVRDIEAYPLLKIEIIRGLFDYAKDESFTNNRLFSVINDNYIIKFNKTEAED